MTVRTKAHIDGLTRFAEFRDYNLAVGRVRSRLPNWDYKIKFDWSPSDEEWVVSHGYWLDPIPDRVLREWWIWCTPYDEDSPLVRHS